MSVLFVCTGNTCRSAMAEGIYNHLYKGATSRGVMADEGSPASENAVKVMAKIGIDITNHRAKQLRREDIENADIVICMTGGHKMNVLSLFPEAKEKVFSIREYLHAADVLDPYGRGEEEYERCAEELYEYVQKIVIYEKLKEL